MSTQAAVKKVIDASQETTKALDPEAYLIGKGWEKFDNNLWYDPLKPRKASECKVKVMDRLLEGGRTEAVYQTVITPAQFPISLAEAMSVQRARDSGGE